MSKKVIRHKQIDIKNLRPQTKSGTKKTLNSTAFVSSTKSINKSPYKFTTSPTANSFVAG